MEIKAENTQIHLKFVLYWCPLKGLLFDSYFIFYAFVLLPAKCEF